MSTKKKDALAVNNSEIIKIESEIVNTTLIPEQGLRIMQAMNGKIDEWAIFTREGRGGKFFDYIPHGYVAERLNSVFGPFWDWIRVEVSPGKMYDSHEYQIDAKQNGVMVKKDVVEINVAGQLVIKIFSADGTLIDTIKRSGTGSKVWERNTSFADAEQSADSDAFKRAAFRLGRAFGLQLYYDDEERRAEWQEKFKVKPPSNISQLLAWLQKNNISDETYESVVGVSIDVLEEKDVEETYNALSVYLEMAKVEA